MNRPRLPSAAAALDLAGIGYRLHQHPPARTEAELHLTGLDVQTSAKTLAFALPDGRIALAVIPGPARLSYGDLARALGVPRSALRPAGAAELEGLDMEPGGVSPVSTDPRVQLVLDASLPDSPVLFCGSGAPDSSIEISGGDLMRFSPTAVVAELTRS